MNNSFLKQFSQNIKFKYFCFDRVIIRGYTLPLFFPAGIVRFLRPARNAISALTLLSYPSLLNYLFRKENDSKLWQAGPSEGGGTDGAKSKFVEQKYAAGFTGKGNHVFCILTDKEPVRTFACRQLTSKSGKPYDRVYECTRLQKLCFRHCGQGKPVKQYYIYFHDALLGGPCYLKISSYLPFHCEFYFNGHNAIQLRLDSQGIKYRLKDNAFVEVEDPEALQKAAESLDGRAVLNRINLWMNMFFRFDKGKYSTRSKFLEHGWYLSQIEISSNVVFRPACQGQPSLTLLQSHLINIPQNLAITRVQAIGGQVWKSLQSQRVKMSPLNSLSLIIWAVA